MLFILNYRNIEAPIYACLRVGFLERKNQAEEIHLRRIIQLGNRSFVYLLQTQKMGQTPKNVIVNKPSRF